MIGHAVKILVVAGTALACAAPASATTIVYTASLSGSNEVPPNASTASGAITVTLDDVANTLDVSEWFTGLSGNASGAHIHCCAAVGSNAAVAVPFGGFPAATSGTYNFTFNLLQTSTYTAGFITGSGGTVTTARNKLINGLAAGTAYANIHDALFPGGEIRGQLSAIPEPVSWSMMLGGFGAIGGALRSRRRTAISFG